MGRETIVLELNTDGLSQEFLDAHRNDILREAINNAITPGDEASWHVKASVDHTKSVHAKVDVTGMETGDLVLTAENFNINRLENIESLRASIENIEAANIE